MKTRSCRTFLQIVAAALMITSLSVNAEQKLDRDALNSRMQSILKDKAQTQSAADKGEKFTGFCSNCHGTDGIGKKPWRPNLAAQDATYLLNQLLNFSDNTRKHQVMNDLVAHLTGEDMVHIALYYSTMENGFRPTITDLEQVKRGKKIYTSNCTQCHMSDGMGKPGLARLAGQQPEYLVRNLRKFRFGTKRDQVMGQALDELSQSEVDDATNYVFGNRRHSEIMGPIVEKLTDNEIEDVAHYISSMVLETK